MKKKLYEQKWGEDALKDKKLVRDIDNVHELLDDAILSGDEKGASERLSKIANVLTKIIATRIIIKTKPWFSYEELMGMKSILKSILWDYIRDTGTIVNNQNIDLVMENAIKSLFGKLVFTEVE